MPSKRPPPQPKPVTISTTYLGGINQNRDENVPAQCRDAVNLWAPTGAVERRPGSVGIASPQQTTLLPPPTFSGISYLQAYDVSAGAYNTAAPGAVLTAFDDEGDQIYVAVDATRQFQAAPYWSSRVGPMGSLLLTYATSPNAITATNVTASYWNGSVWAPLHVTKLAPLPTLIVVAPPIFDVSLHALSLSFVMPTDIQQVAVNTITRYWLRLTLVNAGMTAATGISNTPGPVFSGYPTVQPSLFPLDAFIFAEAGNAIVIYPFQSGGGGGGNNCYDIAGNQVITAATSAPATATAVELFDRGFNSEITPSPVFTGSPITFAAPSSRASLDVQVTSFTAIYPTQIFVLSSNGTIVVDFLGGPPTVLPATIDTSDAAIGPGAPYDPTSVATLSYWPSGKYIAMLDNQLFIADDTVLRWSGPAPYHRVWPGLQFETIESDNSAVTALHSFAGRLFLGKQKNFYATTLDSIDDFGMTHYTLSKVINGVGPVGNNAMFACDNRLIFLAEQGIYAIDATNQLTKPSHWVNPNDTSVANPNNVEIDRLADFWPTINSSFRQNAAGIDWKAKGMMLLSVPTGASTVNDTTLVWDYHRNTWWFWRGFNAQLWAIDEGPFGVQTLYYSNEYGQVFQIVEGVDNDNGTKIEWSVLSEPLGYKSGYDFTLRQAAIEATNKMGTLQVEIYKDDNFDEAYLTTNVDFDDYREGKWGTAKWGVDKWVSNRTRRRFNTFNTDFRNLSVKISQTSSGGDARIGKIEIEILPVEKTFTRRHNVG